MCLYRGNKLSASGGASFRRSQIFAGQPKLAQLMSAFTHASEDEPSGEADGVAEPLRVMGKWKKIQERAVLVCFIAVFLIVFHIFECFVVQSCRDLLFLIFRQPFSSYHFLITITLINDHYQLPYIFFNLQVPALGKRAGSPFSMEKAPCTNHYSISWWFESSRYLLVRHGRMNHHFIRQMFHHEGGLT